MAGDKNTTGQTWTKTITRSGGYGNVYRNEEGWEIEQVLEGTDVGSVQTSYRYHVSHFVLYDPKGEEQEFPTLAAAKSYVKEAIQGRTNHGRTGTGPGL